MSSKYLWNAFSIKKGKKNLFGEKIAQWTGRLWVPFNTFEAAMNSLCDDNYISAGSKPSGLDSHHQRLHSWRVFLKFEIEKGVYIHILVNLIPHSHSSYKQIMIWIHACLVWGICNACYCARSARWQSGNKFWRRTYLSGTFSKVYTIHNIWVNKICS